MPLLFIDYTNLVLKAYEERRDANRLSRLLMHPTTANIRQECLNVYNERIKTGEIEEDILKAFFGVPPVGRNFDYVIERYHADRFRPLRSLIKRKIRIPALVTVELLAWLIDFNPRPLAFAQKILGITNPPDFVSPLKGNDQGQPETDMVETNLEEIKNGPSSITILDSENIPEDGGDKIPVTGNEEAGNSVKDSKGNSQISGRKIAASIILIIAVFFGGMYIWKQEKSKETVFGNVNTGCMYWASDHYEKVPCNEEAKGRIIIPLNEEKIKNFKRITKEDTITERSIGKVHYIKDNGVKFYTEAGNYPEDLNRNLRPLSRYMYNKYVLKKEISGIDSLADKN